MGVARTKTIKNKHFAPKGDKGGKGSQSDGASKAPRKPKGKVPSKEVRKSSLSAILSKKKKQKTYTAEELGIPKLNSITPVGVEKPKGKKKGKVFVDDPESMRTILALVQAEKEGQIESKMIKARQLEEIREARKAEAEKKEQERKAKLEDVKDSIRRKRKRNLKGGDDDADNTKDLASAGTKASKPKKKKVAFA